MYRPWGWYDSIDEGDRFKVKRILVKPKASLSLQKHRNQSAYIPLGETHRLSNPGTILLEIIEVQSGSYLGEDDVVRFEDNYGRNHKNESLSIR